MDKSGFEDVQAKYADFDPQTLVGQFRNLGSHGPAYEIMSVSPNGEVVIEIVYSNERLTETLAEVLQDPIAETIP